MPRMLSTGGPYSSNAYARKVCRSSEPWSLSSSTGPPLQTSSPDSPMQPKAAPKCTTSTTRSGTITLHCRDLVTKSVTASRHVAYRGMTTVRKYFSRASCALSRSSFSTCDPYRISTMRAESWLCGSGRGGEPAAKAEGDRRARRTIPQPKPKTTGAPPRRRVVRPRRLCWQSKFPKLVFDTSRGDHRP